METEIWLILDQFKLMLKSTYFKNLYWINFRWWRFTLFSPTVDPTMTPILLFKSFWGDKKHLKSVFHRDTLLESTAPLTNTPTTIKSSNREKSRDWCHTRLIWHISLKYLLLFLLNSEWRQRKCYLHLNRPFTRFGAMMICINDNLKDKKET